MSGQTVVLKDLGVTKLRGHGRGDLVVHIEVETPTKLNKEQEELVKKLLAARNEDLKKFELHRNTEKGHKGFFERMKDAFTS